MTATTTTMTTTKETATTTASTMMTAARFFDFLTLQEILSEKNYDKKQIFLGFLKNRACQKISSLLTKASSGRGSFPTTTSTLGSTSTLASTATSDASFLTTLVSVGVKIEFFVD